MVEPKNSNQKRLHHRAIGAVNRALAGAGVSRFTIRDSAGWDVVDLPFGGRLKVTVARNMEVRRRLAAWVEEHQERHRWGASVFFNRYGQSGFSVELPLEEFAMLVGKLSEHERHGEGVRE